MLKALRVAAALGIAAGCAVLPQPPASADDIRARQSGFLRVIEAEKAWRTTRGAGVTVAVVDSGVDANQADLRGSVTTGPNMIKKIDGSATPKRLHGTGMASIIAGHGHGAGNASGVIGLAPQAKILAVRSIAEPEDTGYPRYKTSEDARESVADGIRYAADHGADVINLSLGNYDPDPGDRSAIAYAVQKNVVVVSAVGNDGTKQSKLDENGFAPYSYPASFFGVIGVTATTPGGAHAPFANKNYSAVVAAPGVGLAVAGPGSSYYISDGTSDASAVVSGIAALIRARHRGLAPAVVAQAILTSAQGGGYSPELGNGQVGAARALAAADRLAGAGAQTGLAAGRRFGSGDAGPVTVIHRPVWMRPLIVVVLVAGIGGAAVGLCVAVALLRRARATGP
ncbi:S8 family serine peptidase [Actinomadura atramentaria]|uniref:S8 family serine peptidase n=1 Tax=Actinomadura atramentaria TaxID=1990 RepID=UPI0003687B4D|nr:S8 family serine peptidase [Actinomadura atramentaria]